MPRRRCPHRGGARSMFESIPLLLGEFASPSALVALATLTLLEIVLGIDNLIFISIVTERLPPGLRQRARLVGLSLALIMRMLLLAFVARLLLLEKPILEAFDHSFSWRDVIFIAGGLFLIAKATVEIVTTVEKDAKQHALGSGGAVTMGGTIVQIVVLDMIFSVDSILTAFGLTRAIPIMAVAIIIAMVVMVVAAKPLAEFVNRYVSVKILALAFLVLIGVVLIADGFHLHIPRPYVYFALAFSLAVQALTLIAMRKQAGT
jgi:predicted tellurium resistance membrane protein TerC